MERLTDFYFCQMQMIGIGKNGKPIGKVNHVLMKAVCNILRIAKFIHNHTNNLWDKDIVLIWPHLFTIQIEPTKKLLFLCGKLDKTHSIAAITAVISFMYA